MNALLINMTHWNCILKFWVIIASYQDLFWVMIGRINFCPGPFMHPHLQQIHLWFQHKADSDGACPAKPWIITQTSSKSGQMCANDPPDHKEKLQAPCCSNFQKRNYQLAWDVTISAAIQLHCLAMTLLSNSQNLQKVETDIDISNGNALGRA